MTRPDPQDVIRATYVAQAQRPLDFVGLVRIREALAAHGFSREEQDSALRETLASGKAALEPEPFGFRVGPEERLSAIRIGGEDRHKIQMQVDPSGGNAGAAKLATAATPTATATPTGSATRTPPAPPSGKSAAPAGAKTQTPGKTTHTSPTRGSMAGGKAMGTLPPKLDILGKEAEDNTYKIAELLQLTFQQTATWCESTANQAIPDLAQLLRDEGLDGGGRWSQLLHGGDAMRTARHSMQPLYVIQADLENAARTAVVWGNRQRIEIYDAIAEVRRMKAQGGNGRIQFAR